MGAWRTTRRTSATRFAANHSNPTSGSTRALPPTTKRPSSRSCRRSTRSNRLASRPSSNIRVILDGEEEAGSTSLVPAIAKYRDKLTADAMIILDSPVHPSERPTIVYGARGNVTVQLTVFGPKFALHSGHYGNWAPNPAMRLAELLATMKDDSGKVLVDGFYDGIPPPTAAERAILDAVPDDPAALQKLFGIAGPESSGLKLQDALQLPSLNVRGLSSGFVGADARTIIPDKAIADIDIRLVKETPASASSIWSSHISASRDGTWSPPIPTMTPGPNTRNRESFEPRRWNQRVSHVAAAAHLTSTRARPDRCLRAAAGRDPDHGRDGADRAIY